MLPCRRRGLQCYHVDVAGYNVCDYNPQHMQANVLVLRHFRDLAESSDIVRCTPCPFSPQLTSLLQSVDSMFFVFDIVSESQQ